MTIYWDDVNFGGIHQNLIERVLVAGAECLNLDERCEVSVILASSEEICRINHNYRGTDSETDVLSFPGFPGSLALGDIVICLEAAERQAKEYGHSFERELAFLAVHGFLHLSGYGHDTPEEEESMCALQEKILQSIGVGR
ncbi:MAG: rRNA maturation RNase YbeY [Defluviitaleaceae bacterium]|nr:rRNA maturation RNase YbeY [Defluviitaleaceae bacterium]